MDQCTTITRHGFVLYTRRIIKADFFYIQINRELNAGNSHACAQPTKRTINAKVQLHAVRPDLVNSITRSSRMRMDTPPPALNNCNV